MILYQVDLSQSTLKCCALSSCSQKIGVRMIPGWHGLNAAGRWVDEGGTVSSVRKARGHTLDCVLSFWVFWVHLW